MACILMNIDQIRAMKGSYMKDGMQTGDWAYFYDEQGKYVLAQYSHSEITTPDNRHWTMGREYFRHCLSAKVWGIPSFIDQNR